MLAAMQNRHLIQYSLLGRSTKHRHNTVLDYSCPCERHNEQKKEAHKTGLEPGEVAEFQHLCSSYAKAGLEVLWQAPVSLPPQAGEVLPISGLLLAVDVEGTEPDEAIGVKEAVAIPEARKLQDNFVRRNSAQGWSIIKILSPYFGDDYINQ